MSALTDLFTAMANKIRSKTGTQTTYTPSEMASDGIDDVYDAGVASVPQPTSITPSNASPVSLTANTAVKPTASGYAIASYSTLYPNNTSIQSIQNGSIYKATANGGAIESWSELIPSNSSPVTLSDGNIYRTHASGYAIASYTPKTPSDTSPASVSSGAIIKASSAGYLVKNTPVNIGAPDVISQANMSANTSRNITVTKTPRYIIFFLIRTSDTNGRNYCTCYDVGKDTYTYEYYGGDGYAKTETASGKPSLITTVSSTTVTVNNTVAATCRSHALIYY